MELIASSRIVKAQQAVDASPPYARELLRSIGLAASHTPNIKHPLLTTEPEIRDGVPRRGAAHHRGPWPCRCLPANTIKAAERLTETLKARGVEAVPFIVGRKGVVLQVPRTRGRPLVDWVHRCPTYEDAKKIAAALLRPS